MNLNEAFAKAVKAYYEGDEPKEMKSAGQDLRYTKAYFDSIEEEFGLSDIESKDEKELKSKKKKEEED